MLRILRSPITTAILFVAAAFLLGFGGINAVQAAPRFQSNVYGAEVVLTNIETALTEYGEVREGDDQLVKDTLLAHNNDDSLKIGKKYDYTLGVRNVGVSDKGGIEQYVRVTVNKYWVLTDENGNPLKDDTGKDVSLDPSLIKVEWNVGGDSPWSIYEDSSVKGDKYVERTVLNYSGTLAPGEDSTEPLTKSITIDPKVLKEITDASSGFNYDYDKVEFRIKATVDAVQTHNPDPAMKSAWGYTNA